MPFLWCHYLQTSSITRQWRWWLLWVQSNHLLCYFDWHYLFWNSCFLKVIGNILSLCECDLFLVIDNIFFLLRIKLGTSHILTPTPSHLTEASRAYFPFLWHMTCSSCATKSTPKFTLFTLLMILDSRD